MFVCVCKAVSDREIKQLIADGASTVGEIMECTGAGTCCGSCIGEIARLVEERRPGAAVLRRVLPILPSSNAA